LQVLADGGQFLNGIGRRHEAQGGLPLSFLAPLGFVDANQGESQKQDNQENCFRS
jgi:hypothetical protein